MADPTIYEPSYDFVATDKGADLNVELQNIGQSIGEMAAALAEIRRSDGQLQNRIVTVDALDPLSIATLGDEIPADLADQIAGSLAEAEASATAAAASATSAASAATSATVAVVDATAQAVAAAASASSALVSEGSALASSILAADSAGSAAASATGAAGSASAAATSATAAATSASASATSATAAAASAAAAAATLAASRYAFSARKSADQTGIMTGVSTKMDFPVEEFDFGGYYDAANSKFTPPAGKYRLSAGLGWSSGLVDGRQVTVEIWKNGAVFRMFAVQVSGTSDNALVSGSCLVAASGTDYFEVYGSGLGINNKTVVGTVSVSYFEGEAI